ncbi:MAG: hypothetical protein ACPG51_08500 [Thiolinea sp.]
MAGNEDRAAEAVTDEQEPRAGAWHIVGRFFEGLQWLTERVIGLLRMFVTAAMFLVVAFVIYNAWESRNTVAVKPFQVPVAMGKKNHEQAGRIIANLLNRHLLDAQSTLQSQLNRDGVNLSHPVAAEQQVLIEGESIKLPETGITIDNVIEFISGIFGRKNLNGSVYYEADLLDPAKTKLHLQITLRGRIISFSEDDLGEERKLLPATRPNGLNIQLISAMLKARTREILSIASEDHNLYYYCTHKTQVVEHDVGSYKRFFDFCRQLQKADATPKSLLALKTSLAGLDGHFDKSIVGSVLTYLKEESHKRQATLCQSKTNQSDTACEGVNVADARSYTRTVETVVDNDLPTDGGSSELANIQPVEKVIHLNSMRAVESECHHLVTQSEQTSGSVVAILERQCFAENPVQQTVQPALAAMASPAETLQANQAEGDATQLLHNGLYAEALAKYQEAISLNCGNAVAWANMGILLSTADEESGVLDLKQAQCALYRATTLNDNAGWMRHSLCVAQAKRAEVKETKLEDFLSYESCLLARQLEPINDALYDKLFYIDIGDRYRELQAYESAKKAYVQALSNERARNCKTRTAIKSLLALAKNGVENVSALACEIYKKTEPTAVEEDAPLPECELELNKLMAEQNCV